MHSSAGLYLAPGASTAAPPTLGNLQGGSQFKSLPGSRTRGASGRPCIVSTYLEFWEATVEASGASSRLHGSMPMTVQVPVLPTLPFA